MRKSYQDARSFVPYSKPDPIGGSDPGTGVPGFGIGGTGIGPGLLVSVPNLVLVLFLTLNALETINLYV